jgi:hypothetical protein
MMAVLGKVFPFWAVPLFLEIGRSSVTRKKTPMLDKRLLEFRWNRNKKFELVLEK